MIAPRVPEMPNPPIPKYRYFTYFAISGCGNYLKIGSTVNPRARINGLRQEVRKYFGKDATIEYIAVFESDMHLEMELHRCWADYRIGHWTSDWHSPVPSVFEYLQIVSDRFICIEDYPFPKLGPLLNPAYVPPKRRKKKGIDLFVRTALDWRRDTW